MLTKKILALLIVASALFLIVYFTIHSKDDSNNKVDDQQASTSIKALTQSKPSHDCNDQECLTVASPEEIYGTAIIEGYYTATQKEAWGEKKICDEFVITGGSETVRDYFRYLVEMGNTVNRKDSLDNPIINIHPEELDSASRMTLLKSTASKKISLQVDIPQSHGTGAPACYSFVTLKRVK